MARASGPASRRTQIRIRIRNNRDGHGQARAMIVPLQVAHPVRRPIAWASPRAAYPVGSIKVLNANGRGQWHCHQLSASTRLLIRKNSRGEMDPHRDFVA